MSALDNLNAAIAKLDADVKALVAKPPVLVGVPEADVQAAADAVAAIDLEIAPALP